jgi:membrane associated rhomboid family serine protease
MIGSGFIAYLILMNSSIKEEIYSPILPVIIVVILSYIVGSIFLSVFSFSATAILHAFLLNEELGGNIHPP